MKNTQATYLTVSHIIFDMLCMAVIGIVVFFYKLNEYREESFSSPSTRTKKGYTAGDPPDTYIEPNWVGLSYLFGEKNQGNKS